MYFYKTTIIGVINDIDKMLDGDLTDDQRLKLDLTKRWLQELKTRRKEEIKREQDSHTENITEWEHFDSFKCSKCGIQLEGWTRHDVEYDDDIYNQYVFKFCPECGRRVEE